uniref:Secreted protein n=1 Tax=Utricularia reniformis TaxID=192314 RepID=A0A1Y0B2I6_9LAMI|nr:hypothetical protein AEK19_MT1387 [Utricularia reniformis]ART31583.1 hypothetical protein AEK19_MT1387 [Utricularia reniformis]
MPRGPSSIFRWVIFCSYLCRNLLCELVYLPKESQLPISSYFLRSFRWSIILESSPRYWVLVACWLRGRNHIPLFFPL